MKKIILFIVFLFTFISGYGQIPSIKQAKRVQEIPVSTPQEQTATTVLEILNTLPTDTIEKYPGAVKFLSDALVKDKSVNDKSSQKIDKNLQDDLVYMRIIDSLDNVKLQGYITSRNEIHNKLKKAPFDQSLIDSLKSARDSITSIEDRLAPNLLFPTLERAKKETFFNKLYSKDGEENFYFLNNAALQVSNEANTVQTEVMSAFCGPVRLSLGSLLSNSSDGEDEPDTETSTNTEAFQRLLSGGGNMYLNVELPVLFYSDGPFVVYTNAYGKGAIDFSAISNDIDTSTANVNAGGNFYASLSTDKNELNFFTTFSYGLYLGGDEFYRALAIEDEEIFGFGQLSFGLTVFNKFRVSVTTNTLSFESHLRSGNVVVGLQVLSGFFEN